MSIRTGLVQRAFTLLEFLAVATILAIIAVIVVPRMRVSADVAKQKVRDHHKAAINAAVERFHRDNHNWPADDLSDIGADLSYFPDGLPVDPIDGAAYSLDAITHRVN